MDGKYYTAGEIAKLSGVSVRTIRFYDSKGLLKPAAYSESGYRYYNRESFGVLQQIIMFKYLGFTLEQIEGILSEDEKNPVKMKERLKQQKDLLNKRKKVLEQLIGAIELAEKCNEEAGWDHLIRILNLLTEEEKIAEQYKTDENLERRIRIHSYSTNPYGWTEWVYDQLGLKEGMKVLEIGCGNGLLWRSNAGRLPNGLRLYLTDYSDGMINQTKNVFTGYRKELKDKGVEVYFQVEDANNISLEEYDFDVIIANHMLYHVEKKQNCLNAIQKRLKSDGTFYCSTVGENHMQELHDLLKEFNDDIEIPLSRIAKTFSLQNGEAQLKKVFTNVEKYEHDSNLIVDDVDAIYDYVYSYPGNAPFLLEKGEDLFRKMIWKRISEEGAMLIHKETGIFVCRE